MATYGDDDLMSVIARVADGDATREEAVAALRKRKVDALDVLVEYLARTGQDERRQRAASRIDVTTVKQPARAKRDGPPHQTPRLPFQLNGTMYEPQDLSRFDDTDLDFVASEDRILAFDDRTLLDGWLQNSQLTAQMSGDYTSTVPMTKKAEHGETVQVSVVDPGRTGGTGVLGGTTDAEHTGTTSSALTVPLGIYWVWDYIPHTNFYEDIGFDGDRLELRADLQYPDLTEVSMGVFSGSWNDEISSVQFVAMENALLGEHVNFGGSRLLLNFHQDASDLRSFGWNDRASAVQTWGPLPVAGHFAVATAKV